MYSRWRWILLRLTRRLWLRATLISFLAVAAALASLLISPYLPSGLSAKIGADSVDRILNIIASSMLAVTTFSLSTVVAAYSAATNNVTPRATRLLIEDTTTQNMLATFVGSFLFSLVAIITLSMGAYGERGRVVLFGVTLVVIVLIVITLLRWIDYLLKLGRVGETTEQVEKATAAALTARKELPYLGCMAFDSTVTIPASAKPVRSLSIGYVQHVDTEKLSQLAEQAQSRFYVSALPGTFVDTKRPLGWIDGDDELVEQAVSCFSVDAERSFDQDPRFGLCVMSEIASRALSPGINDPGTAIDVIGRQLRLLSIWAEPAEEKEPEFGSVFVPAISEGDLCDDAFAMISRDGAGMAEVQIRLQKALAMLAVAGDGRFDRVARNYGELARQRAETTMTSDYDRRRVRNAAVWLAE